MITFDPHPRCILDPANCPPMITTLGERLELVRKLGVDEAIVIEFTRELAALEPGDFMDRLLAAMELRRLLAGPDFALGRARAGDLAWLRRHGAEAGYEVEVVEPVRLAGQEVHSSEVRRLLTLGEVEPAGRLLGREYSISGLVQPGDRIGRGIGWPTVNLGVPPGKLVPAHGVYAGWAAVAGATHMAAISVGHRPTFDKTDLRVEAYLLDFDGDLYQQPVELRFASWLHPQLRFADPAALAEQIGRDVEATRRRLSSPGRTVT